MVNEKSDGVNGKVFKIKCINWNSFSIGDTSNYTPYIRNGICKNIKLPKITEYKSFKECNNDYEAFIDPNMSIYDFDKMGDNLSIYICFQAYSLFKKQHKRTPNNWNEEDCK
eukprot:GHVR01164043.1.p1 GENE.GHVR01164043.1~~GHVR01164043.1.p1  ORF type:complete len:112 (+),score=10.02 GHVR01164043.1:279-614(+)